MSCGIYKIINTLDNKYYLGSSINIEERWLKHKSQLRRNIHPNRHLQNAWNKDKEENFKFIILEEIIGDPLIKEQDYLNNLDKKCSYNIAEDAFCPIKGVKMSDESRQKMSKARRGNLNHFYGRKHSKESIKKISNNRQGKCVGRLNPFYGKTHSDEILLLLTLKAIKKPCKIDNISYNSAKEASVKLGINYTTIKGRLRNKNFKNYYYIGEEK